MSWLDAQAYVEWLSHKTGWRYRLPTEAEWEYAARAGTTTRYAFGDAITPKDANYSESKLGKTTEVGSYPPNAWGLYDMHGNVWEWVEDVWHDSYEGAPTDGARGRDEGNSSRYRVLRGGSWDSAPGGLRSALRVGIGPDDRVDDLGFRVARTLEQEPVALTPAPLPPEAPRREEPAAIEPELSPQRHPEAVAAIRPPQPRTKYRKPSRPARHVGRAPAVECSVFGSTSRRPRQHVGGRRLPRRSPILGGGARASGTSRTWPGRLHGSGP